MPASSGWIIESRNEKEPLTMVFVSGPAHATRAAGRDPVLLSWKDPSMQVTK
jgi:hypothetical protein